MVEFNYNRYSQIVENLIIIIGGHRYALVVLYFDMGVDIMLNDMHLIFMAKYVIIKVIKYFFKG